MKDDDDEASFHVVVVDSGPLLEGEYSLCHHKSKSESDQFLFNGSQAKHF